MNIRRVLSINSFIESLIMSDFLMFFALGLLSPIFAIYISERIPGSNLEVIGLAAATYWLVRSVTVIPLSRFMDRTDGEKDEFLFLISGSFLAALIPLFYIWATAVWHIYLLQVFLAIAYSMAVPGWRILFINHLDSGKMGYEWSLEDVAIGIGTAISAYVGSVIAGRFGFTTLFICISVVCFMGTIILIPLRHQMRTRKELLRARKTAT
jgi:MFS family permease